MMVYFGVYIYNFMKLKNKQKSVKHLHENEYNSFQCGSKQIYFFS